MGVESHGGLFEYSILVMEPTLTIREAEMQIQERMKTLLLSFCSSDLSRLTGTAFKEQSAFRKIYPFYKMQTFSVLICFVGIFDTPIVHCLIYNVYILIVNRCET